MPRKLGRTSKERNALLRGLASQLLWYGKIETTVAKAKSVEKNYIYIKDEKVVNYSFNVLE